MDLVHEYTMRTKRDPGVQMVGPGPLGVRVVALSRCRVGALARCREHGKHGKRHGQRPEDQRHHRRTQCRLGARRRRRLLAPRVRRSAVRKGQFTVD